MFEPRDPVNFWGIISLESRMILRIPPYIKCVIVKPPKQFALSKNGLSSDEVALSYHWRTDYGSRKEKHKNPHYLLSEFAKSDKRQTYMPQST